RMIGSIAGKAAQTGQETFKGISVDQNTVLLGKAEPFPFEMERQYADVGNSCGGAWSGTDRRVFDRGMTEDLAQALHSFVQTTIGNLDISIGPERSDDLRTAGSAFGATNKVGQQGTDLALLPERIGDGLPLLTIVAFDAKLSQG